MVSEAQLSLISFLETADRFKGHTIEIHETISLNKDNFDRHFSSFSNFSFVLTNFGIRFSGAKIFFMGDQFQYELHFDVLKEFCEISPTEYSILEVLSGKVNRKTIITFK